jgi:hypothetical protein
MKETFPASTTPGRWTIPFSHHPVLCKGPMHGDARALGYLAGLFQAAGVKVVLAGHEHNDQHVEHERIHYLVTGGAAKLRDKPPTQGFQKSRPEAALVDSAVAYHYLLVTVRPDTVQVRAIGVDGREVAKPVVIT